MEEIFRKFSSRDGKMSKVDGRNERERVGRQMADAFYPFVGEGPADIPGLATPANEGAGQTPAQTPNPQTHVLGTVVSNPARIAVFDDPAAAPRVVVVQPKDIRSYLEEVTATVTRLAKEQGGRISFTVIREVVENLVHAYFIEPTISILDGGNTIRFSDQGPGIREKGRALEYGTTSATEEMKQYIRGVGSGLPYAQQYMEDHGGTLTIEDNIHSGTIVTISLPSEGEGMLGRGTRALAGEKDVQAAQMQGYPQQVAAYPQQITPQQAMPQQGVLQMPPQQASQQMPPQQATQQQGAPFPQQAMPYQQPYPPYGYPQQPGYPMYPAQYAQQVAPQQPAAPQPQIPARQTDSQQASTLLDLSERAQQVLEWLVEHESVGPTDLTRAYGGSLSTWTRQLQELEDQGILRKRGQKRYLTNAGRALI